MTMQYLRRFLLFLWLFDLFQTLGTQEAADNFSGLNDVLPVEVRKKPLVVAVLRVADTVAFLIMSITPFTDSWHRRI